ncbi:hypothetical protein GCM10027615_36990 [Plantactinospora veratri]
MCGTAFFLATSDAGGVSVSCPATGAQMTKDDAARKRKARQRAAETGESYTRAARELDQDPPSDVSFPRFDGAVVTCCRLAQGWR